MSDSLILRASASRWRGADDYDVLSDGEVVGRIFLATFAAPSSFYFATYAPPRGKPWMWTLAYGHDIDRTPTHGFAVTREAALMAFAKSWRREG